MQKSHSRNVASPEAMSHLLQIMAILRDSEAGCAWDKKQTLRSLTSHTVEEVYEVVDAVESEDALQLCDELGDLLFQIVFYARIAEEAALFDFEDVAEAINRKLLRRHPHIFPAGTIESFGTRAADTSIDAEQVEVNWELIKKQERIEKFARESANPASQISQHRLPGILEEVPRALPALDRAKKLQKRAAAIGFDWPDVQAAMGKLDEEGQELRAAIADKDQASITHEVGDLLFTCVNIARHLKVEPETALRETNRRFEKRFHHMEDAAREHERSLADLTANELDVFWNMAKSKGL